MFKTKQIIGMVLVVSTFSSTVAFADVMPASCRALKRVRSSLKESYLSIPQEERALARDLTGLALAGGGSVVAVNRFLNARAIAKLASAAKHAEVTFQRWSALETSAELAKKAGRFAEADELKQTAKVLDRIRENAMYAYKELLHDTPEAWGKWATMEEGTLTQALEAAVRREAVHGVLAASVAFTGVTLILDADDLNASEESDLRARSAKAILDPNMPEELACAAIEQDSVMKYRIFKLQQALQHKLQSTGSVTAVGSAHVNTGESKTGVSTFVAASLPSVISAPAH